MCLVLGRGVGGLYSQPQGQSEDLLNDHGVAWAFLFTFVANNTWNGIHQ